MKIDVFHDTVCPWCRIGKTHLLQALEAWHEEPVEISYRAFLLDPSTPPEGRPMSSFAEKVGSQDVVDQMHQRVCQVGEACGLDFHFENIAQLPNTILSHQLIKLTPMEGQQAMVEALNDAYFEQGLDIGQMSVLLDIARAQGLNRTEVEQQLTSERMLPAVLEDLAFARDAKISGVPLFIFNDQYALSGAQPVEAFLQALKQIHAQA